MMREDAQADARDAGDVGDAAVADADADVAPTCDTTALLSATPCLVTDAYGVFVMPNGSDAGNGTKAQPFANMQQASPPPKHSTNVSTCAASVGRPQTSQRP